jgi:hypothetical protein
LSATIPEWKIQHKYRLLNRKDQERKALHIVFVKSNSVPNAKKKLWLPGQKKKKKLIDRRKKKQKKTKKKQERNPFPSFFLLLQCL